LIDLHCHILPGVDDGAKDLGTSLEMAKMAVADGIQAIACTPHILPGVYPNSGPDIRRSVDHLRTEIEAAGIPLRLTYGADVHVAPDLTAQLRNGQALSLHGGRYFLFEPPHHVPPPRLADQVFSLLSAGFVPIITHPERLTWIEKQYSLITALVKSGALLQITAGSLTGRFGKRPKYWSERILDEGLCHILATDAHDPDGRPPKLAEGRDVVARRFGSREALNTVFARPLGILSNVLPSELEPLPESTGAPEQPQRSSFWGDMLKRVAAGGRR